MKLSAIGRLEKTLTENTLQIKIFPIEVDEIKTFIRETGHEKQLESCSTA
ncbi:hypothetical protein ACRB9V_23355 [Salmonella enterica subsp. enterica serovar Paratyphi A]